MNHDCDCHHLPALSFASIKECQSAALQIIEENSNRRPTTLGDDQQIVFSKGGRLGVAIPFGKDSSPWDQAAIAVPSALGVFVSLLEQPVEHSVSHFALTGRLFSPASGMLAAQQIWYGALKVSLDKDGNVETMDHTDYENVPNQNNGRRYDWKCLARCAPSCLSCMADPACWAICAGVCVITCAFP